MTGLVRKAAVLAACGVLFGAAVAYAGVPDPFNSTIPLRINLVGIDAGTSLPDSTSSLSKVTVTVRDLSANPIANSSVVLDFSGDLSDTRIADVQPYQGLTTNCATHGISALTNASGVATFVVVGGGTAAVGAPHAAGGKVYADGVLLGSIRVGLFDLDGVGGVQIPDLSRWSADFFGGANPERSDFDDAGGVQVPDLAVWSASFFAGKSNSSSATYCP